eukprot:c16705_g1_i1 orf=195-920(+)
MAYMGTMRGMEMPLAHSSCKPIKPEISPAASMQRPHSIKSLVSRSAKSKAWSLNHIILAPARRVLFIQILAIFGTMLCDNPVLVDGLARADEKKSYLLFGPGEVPNDEAVLQGSPYTARLARAKMSSLLLSKEDEPEEILSVKLKLLRSKASAFRVFINMPDATEQTAITCPEFSGLYFHEPRRVKSPAFEYQETLFRIGVGDIIKDLGLVSQPSILVTFVPCGADKDLPVVLERVQMELE